MPKHVKHTDALAPIRSGHRVFVHGGVATPLALLDALVEECRVRRIAHLDVTVDASNEGAQRFYRRHGFVSSHRFTLYGREMDSLRRDVSAREVVK